MGLRKSRFNKALALLSLALALAVGVAWVVSAVSFPHVRGAWPGGAGEAQDHGLVCLLDGRLIVLRRVATLVSSAPGLQMTLREVPVPANPNDWPPPTPQVRVDLRDVRTVTVLDYSVRPPIFAPESYSIRANERDLIASYPWGWLGFELGGNRAAKPFTISSGSVTVTEHRWAIPFWPLILLLLFPGARWLWQNRQSQRWLMAGRCTGCGYDLRATPEQCPECGQPAVPAT